MKYWIAFLIFAVPLNIIAAATGPRGLGLAAAEGFLIGVVSGLASFAVQRYL